MWHKWEKDEWIKKLDCNIYKYATPLPRLVEFHLSLVKSEWGDM